MRPSPLVAQLTVAACLIAGTASAQQATTPAAPPAAGTAAPATAVQRTGLEKTHGGWRSSQIIGATVYSDKGQDQDIWAINDLIVGPDGKITLAVISVGGFLGIGAKLVGVPYDQLKFEESTQERGAAAPATAPGPGAAPAPGATPGPGATQAPAGNTMGATSPSAAPATTAPAAPAVAVVRTRIVLPGATKDSIKAMPDFKYNG